MKLTLKSKHGPQVCLIDDSDYSLVARYRWYAWLEPKTQRFYVRSTDRKHIYLHRLLLGNVSDVVDHINHDTLDNRRTNLRAVTVAFNVLNRVGAQKNNHSSGLRGVSWSKTAGKWHAYITRNGIRYQDFFTNVEDAKMFVRDTLKRFGVEYGA